MSRITALEAKLSTNGSLSLAEQWEAVRLAKYYRKLLAMQIAERAYLEMKNYGQIDEEIRPLGYMLVRMMNSRIPVLEELKPFSSPVPTGPPEKVGGALDIGKGW